MKKLYIADLFVNIRWYILVGACVFSLVCSFFFPEIFEAAIVLTCFSIVLTIIDYFLLFGMRGDVKAVRLMANRFSLGDENKISISLANTFPYKISIRIIDEIPFQFQERDFVKKATVPYLGRETISYSLRPLTRGVYEFGRLLCYTSSPIGLLQRRITASASASVKVYPSYLQLKKFQLLAASDNLFVGSRKIRKLGHSMEFEKIKNYVQGDDMRTINWKATARRGDVMVNTYTDARQQQVYAIIDKSRSMKMPFNGLTLLDHSINAALSLLNIVLQKQDKAGLITFAQQVSTLLPAERRSTQIMHIMEALYQQQTDFKESDHEALLATLHKKISQRSFLLLFTNFETISSLERQLPFLRKLAATHLVCVVFFQNTLLKTIHESQPDTTEGIYIKTIAERFDYEKKQIVKELRRHGILTVLTTPQSLTVDVINKYLELKAKQMV